MKLTTFKHKSNGAIATYPSHYATHPVFGHDLEVFDEDTEVDKVVTAGHELPVEQRATYFDVSDDDFEDEEI